VHWVEAAVWTNRMWWPWRTGSQEADGIVYGQGLCSAHAGGGLETGDSQQGAAGVDRVSVQRFSRHAQRYLAELAEELRTGVTAPSRSGVYISQGTGRTRPLGIATVKDRIAQAAVKLVLEPIFEREFLPLSYGFRPERSSKTRCGKWRGCSRQVTAGWSISTWKTTSTRSPKDRSGSGRRAASVTGDSCKLVQRFLDQDILERTGTLDADGGHRAGLGAQPVARQSVLASTGSARVTGRLPHRPPMQTMR